MASHFGHGKHIKAYREPGEIPALLQELLGRPDEPGLLTEIHAGRRTAKLITGAGAHFGDHQDIPVTRNDVQLAQAAAKITIENFQALGPEEIRRRLLGRGPQ
jgi:hypothetical protein